MTLASRELHWSRTYFDSYVKTGEAVYLQLAATHCIKAINVLKETQQTLPNTTRFYYQTKTKRVDACLFYKTLQDTSLRLGQHQHMKDIPDQGCDF